MLQDKLIGGVGQEKGTLHHRHVAGVGDGDAAGERLPVIRFVVAVAGLGIIHFQSVDAQGRRVQLQRLGLSDRVVAEKDFQIENGAMVGRSQVVHLETESLCTGNRVVGSQRRDTQGVV